MKGRIGSWCVAVAACLGAACGQTTATTEDASSGDTAADVAQPDTVFPKNFVWGAAIAGFQVDMGCPTLPAAQCVHKKT